MADDSNRAARWLLRILIAVLVMLVAGVGIGLPVSFVAQRGRQLSNQITASRGVAMDRRVRGVEPTLALAPAVDSGISPDSAGRTLHALVTALQRAPSRRSGRAPEQPRAPYVPFPSVYAEDAPFRDLPKSGTPLPDPAPLFARALQGFSREERLWLQDVAEHPVWALHAVVARAPAVDILGGRFVLPFEADTDPFALTITSLTTNNTLVVANGLRASLLLANGERAEAERLLRESIGFGRALMTGPWMMDELMGIAVIGRARTLLTEFYAAVGDQRAEALRAMSAPSETSAMSDERAARAEALAADLPARERQRIAEIRDPGLRTAVRLERLSTLGLLQCTTLRGVLLGSSDAVTAVYAFARDSVARYESERELIRIASEVPASLAGEGRVASRRLPPRAWLLDAWGRLLGSRRIQGCARVLAGYRAM